VWTVFKTLTLSASEKVMGVSHSLYENELENMKDARGVQQDTDLTTEDLKELVQKYKGVYQKAIGKAFPTGTTDFSMCSDHYCCYFPVPSRIPTGICTC